MGAVQRLKRGVFHSVVDLQAAIKRYIDEHNDDPKPFTWTKSAKTIIGKLKPMNASVHCSGTHDGKAVQVGFKFDLTIEDGKGSGLFALATLGQEGVVMGEPYSLKMWRSGDC